MEKTQMDQQPMKTTERETSWVQKPFEKMLQEHGIQELRATHLETLQVNLGKLCNQACSHCHVDAGPKRKSPTENMGKEVAQKVVEILRTGIFEVLDLTGGAPEMNLHFRWLVKEARSLGIRVLDRCNLSVLLLEEQKDLASFLASQGVEIVASLPCYTEERTDDQRGKGVFEASIQALKLLNSLGYGMGSTLPRVHSGPRQHEVLKLNLVYNPGGPFLPGTQAILEKDYKERLWEEHGIRFDQLFTLTNIPIHRFLHFLKLSGQEDSYRKTLQSAFNPKAAGNVMCKSMVSLGHDGRSFDCDFNQMLDWPLSSKKTSILEVPQKDLRKWIMTEWKGRRIRTGFHCFGCTAGAGSSCTGSLL
jgi:radical SAM/Cys-rich protein